MIDVDEILEPLSPAEERAVAIVATMIRVFGRAGGEGLLAGVTRYQALEARLRLAAERSRDVRSFWDVTVRTMQWTIAPAAFDRDILALIDPAPNDAETLAAIAERTGTTVMRARSIVRAFRDAEGRRVAGGTGGPRAARFPARDALSQSDPDDNLDGVL